MTSKGTVAIEEAVVNPDDIAWLAETGALYAPSNASGQSSHHALTQKLADIHDQRLQRMDAEGVDYMLLSITSPGCQGEPDATRANKLAVTSNDWLAREVARNPSRFGGLAALSMHDATEAAIELRRAVKELGMFGALLNDFQSSGPNGAGTKYYDGDEYHVFWKTVEELDVPVYMHPRYPPAPELQPDGKYGPRKHLIGAAVQFHLDLSFHIYALCSSGIFDLFPRAQIVAGHLGEGYVLLKNTSIFWSLYGMLGRYLTSRLVFRSIFGEQTIGTTSPSKKQHGHRSKTTVTTSLTTSLLPLQGTSRLMD
ncbi:2,3-dihydroxybenzoate decarboxylase [Ilyonectria robusta]